MSPLNAQEWMQYKIQPALRECDAHQQRLHQAWLESALFPAMQADMAIPLTEPEVRTLDQLVYRFGRLQDTMGTRLLPALMALMQEWREDAPFIDQLHRAEKLGLLPSAEQWMLLRELRNQTAHEYPDQPEKVLQGLRHLHCSVPELERAYAVLRQVAFQRIPS